MDSLNFRVDFILEGQQHCDHFLTSLANPEGKTVLVVGSGAGTEMLWALRRGAVEVIGLDILEQSPEALLAAARRLGVQAKGRFHMRHLGIEDAGTLGREFDLVLSNNVFEHISDINRAFEVCAALVRPWTGRIAIFTDPLFHSSAGSHLPLVPWEHLWGDEEEIRRRLISELPSDHPLQSMSLDEYLFEEITLNRMRLEDIVTAVERSALMILTLELHRDRNIERLAEYRPRLGNRAATDLTIEGVGLELARAGPGECTASHWFLPVAERNRAASGECIEDRQATERRLQDVLRVLESTERSISFRIGRAVTFPGRWIRDRVLTRSRLMGA
ncbi:MAG TPA: class I SAM-dependent methyltransferase [Thermoanaerobaculia bacterium]|nr:class I SAM-dependent methyltransferase [Thermoanaerobaculia bacterium]